jgi:hypothetical protein
VAYLDSWLHLWLASQDNRMVALKARMACRYWPFDRGGLPLR